MTIEIDDAGVGDLLQGVVIGAYRPETKEFRYDMIEVRFFQPPLFRSKAYLHEASGIAKRLAEKMKVLEREQIVICSSFILEKAVQDLEEKYGKERITLSKITSDAQRLVETAYLDEVRNLGYEPIVEREEKRARSFFHMLRWIKKDPRRFEYAKTGWPRLARYVKARKSPRQFYTQRRKPDARGETPAAMRKHS